MRNRVFASQKRQFRISVAHRASLRGESTPRIFEEQSFCYAKTTILNQVAHRVYIRGESTQKQKTPFKTVFFVFL